MQLRNIFTLTLLILLVIIASAEGFIPCPTCSATHISISENEGTITATVFKTEQHITVNPAYFDKVLSDIPDGQTPTDVATITSEDITTIKDAELYFSYFDKTGTNTPIKDCNPAIANKEIKFVDSKTPPVTKSFYYATCTIPKELYEKSSRTIYIEYKGDADAKPSRRELIIYDVSAGGLNKLASLLQHTAIINPANNPICLSGLIMLGLLLASMYFSGKSPLSYLDISVPRTPKPKPISFGSLIAGAGYIRLGVPAAWNMNALDKIIKTHALVAFREIPKAVKDAIERSKATEIQKYFAKRVYMQGGEWEKILKTDARELFRKAETGEYGKIHSPLLQVMQQRIEIVKVAQEVGIITGNQPLMLKNTTKFIRRVPFIGQLGNYLTVAVGSFFYSLRTGKHMAKALLSWPVRKAMGNKYAESEGKTLKGIKKMAYDIAAFTDANKITLGKIMPLGSAHIPQFYEDTRNSLYDEIIINILRKEVYNQIKNKEGEAHAKELMMSQLTLKNVFADRRYIDALGEVNSEYMHILQNSKLSSRERAEMMINIVRSRILDPEFLGEIQRLFNNLVRIDGGRKENDYLDYHRMEKLVKIMREDYHIDKPTDLTDSIINGKFFITTGRNNLYYEQGEVKKNFGFLTLGFKEFLDQITYSSLYKRDEQPSTLANAFMVAWLKLKNNIFGCDDSWYLEKKDRGYAFKKDTLVPDPKTGKMRNISFVEDMGFDANELGAMSKRGEEYFKSLLTKEGNAKLNEGKIKLTDLLYNVGLLEQQNKEKRALRYIQEHESVPEAVYWKTNMNFIWNTGKNVGGSAATLLYEIHGQKYRANKPPLGNPWFFIEQNLDTRLANMMNGSAWDRSGHDIRDENGEIRKQFQRFLQPNMYKFFNETWDSYVDMSKGFAELYREKKGIDKRVQINYAQMFEFFAKPENQHVTYKMLKQTSMPWIFTHDLGYVPYTRGMGSSDNDRVINGVFVIDPDPKDPTQRRIFDNNKLSMYYHIIGENPTLQNELKALEKLKRPASLEEITRLENMLKSTKILTPELEEHLRTLKGLLNKAANSINPIQNVDELGKGAEAAEKIRKIVMKLRDKDQQFHLSRLVDNVDPNNQALRTLTKGELDHIKNVMKSIDTIETIPSNIRAEVKYAFLKQISSITHDWKTLWADECSRFAKLVPGREVDQNRGWLGKILMRIAEPIETTFYAAGRSQWNAMANLVATSELYRERGHDMWAGIKSGGFLKGLELPPEDMKKLEKSYNTYADSFQQFFQGWIHSVTRDPRGGSTQYGRQWYLSPMYHRGASMVPELAHVAGERGYLDPAKWFTSQSFYRAASLNWIIANPIVNILRGFQSAAYGYPSRWDKTHAPGGGADLLQPWHSVTYSRVHTLRSFLNPLESVFSPKKFNLPYEASRTLQLIPEVNRLQGVFPWLEPRTFQEDKYQISKIPGLSPVYKGLAKVPGFGFLLNHSQAQYSQRIGQNIHEGVKQTPEDFSQYKNAYAQHFTDAANPGLSYTDYGARSNLAPRIASYLTKDITGSNEKDTAAWQTYYSKDEYVRRQARFSMVRREISAEAKQSHFQEEMTGYGPRKNPAWIPVALPFAGYWIGSRIYEKLTTKGEPKTPGTQAPLSSKIKTKWDDIYSMFRKYEIVCPHCNSKIMGKGQRCSNPNCGKYYS